MENNKELFKKCVIMGLYSDSVEYKYNVEFMEFLDTLERDNIMSNTNGLESVKTEFTKESDLYFMCIDYFKGGYLKNKVYLGVLL